MLGWWQTCGWRGLLLIQPGASALRLRALALGGHLLGFGFGLLDRAHVHERGFGASDPTYRRKFLRSCEWCLERGDFTGDAQEHFGHQKRLRQETFDTTSTMHNQLVVFAQFIDTENGDDVLQFAITLQSRLHASSNRIVLGTHILRVENTAVRSQRIDSGVNTLSEIERSR